MKTINLFKLKSQMKKTRCDSPDVLLSGNEQDVFWKKCLPKRWEPILLNEPLKNPWREYGDTCLPPNGTDKVLFREEGHKYVLQDEDGAYPDYLISGTKLITYWDTIVKIKQTLGNHVDLLVEAHKLMALEDDNRRNKERELKRPEMEGPSASTIRTMLINHLNRFDKVKVPSFAERSKSFSIILQEEFQNGIPERILRIIQEEKEDIQLVSELSRWYEFPFRDLKTLTKIKHPKIKSLGLSKPVKEYTQHIRQRVFLKLESWLMSKVESITPEPEFEHDMALILRYLNHPIHGFSTIYVCNEHGRCLSEELEREYKRLLSLGMKVDWPVSEEEIRAVPFYIPNTSGTLLHAHMERTLKGIENEDPLPKMRELEDELHTQAFLKWARENNLNFPPGLIEKRLGSYLYKITGSVDAICLCQDGEYQIFDWKRTANSIEWDDAKASLKLNDSENSAYAFSSDIMKYSIQMSVYRKLLQMDFDSKGIQAKVKDEAILVVFHPINESFKMVTLKLDMPMSSSSLKTTKGIADRVLPNGQVLACEDPLSPIDYVNAGFEKRLEHLKMHFL